MRAPAFIVERLTTLNQSHWLSTITKIETLPGGSEHRPLIRELAERIDGMVEDQAFELTDRDRVLLSSTEMLPVLEAFAAELRELMAEGAVATEANDIEAFVRELAERFGAIAADEKRNRAWFEFLDGRWPDAPPVRYSFEKQTPMACSFCGKTQKEVRKLIAGPTAYICDECIGLCSDIVAEEPTG